MDSFWQDLRQSLRALLKSPVFTGVAVLTMGLGIGATSTVFSVVNGVVLRPFPFKDPDQLVALHQNDLQRGLDDMSVSLPDFHDWREQSRSFSQMAAYEIRSFNLTVGDQPERVEGVATTVGLFETLGIRPSLGRAFQPADDRAGAAKVAVVSHSLWQRSFSSDPQVIGKVIRLGGESHTIVGVAPPEFKYPNQSEVWVPLALDVAQEPRTHHFLTVVARLRDGASLEQARSEMIALNDRLAKAYPSLNTGIGVVVLPLRDYYVNNAKPVFTILLAAVGFVLLIACSNVGNMLLARGIARQREIAVRTALGASRFQVVRQLLTESFWLGLFGGLLGLLLTFWGLRLLLASIPAQLPFWIKVNVDGRVLVFALTVSVLSGVLLGLLPGLRLSRLNVGSMLREGSTGATPGAGRRRLSRVLVIGEVALSMVLLFCAALMVQSFIDLQRIDPGFRADRLLTLQVSELPRTKYPDGAQVGAFYQTLLDRVRGVPGVVSVGADSQLPLKSRAGNEVFFRVKDVPASAAGELLPIANYQVVTPDYFRTMEIPLLKGQPFEERHRADSAAVVIVNEALARRFWPEGDPVGKQLGFGAEGEWMTIVGVAGNVRHRAMGNTPMPDIYVPHQQLPVRAMTLVVRTTGDPESVAPAVRREILALDRDLPVYGVMSMREVIANSLSFELFGTRMLFIFGALALILSAVALYGLVAYSTNQRSHEIGLRMALGARAGDVVRLIVRQGMILALIGLGLGLPLALLLNKVLSNVLYGVSGTEVVMIAAVLAVLALVALVASYIPARRASRIHPIIALRSE